MLIFILLIKNNEVKDRKFVKLNDQYPLRNQVLIDVTNREAFTKN
jgi:hypothetical protein